MSGQHSHVLEIFTPDIEQVEVLSLKCKATLVVVVNDLTRLKLFILKCLLDGLNFITGSPNPTCLNSLWWVRIPSRLRPHDRISSRSRQCVL